MITRQRRFGFIVAIVCSAVCAASCSHPVNDDGNDITNPQGANPGAASLMLSAATTSLGVGESVAITATYGGRLLNSGGETPVTTISDPGVIVGSAFGATGTSVGGATITATYQGSTATISFTVHAKNGLSALVSDITDGSTGTSAWRPPAIRVVPGSTVEFTVSNNGVSHSVVFDAVPGAPADIPTGPPGSAFDRTFSTAGSFSYKCSIHGESGVVSVVAP